MLFYLGGVAIKPRFEIFVTDEADRQYLNLTQVYKNKKQKTVKVR